MADKSSHSEALLHLKPPQRKATRRWKFLGAVACFSVVLWHLHLGPYHKPSHHKNTHLHRYPGEAIAWEPCGALAGRPLECSRVEVPMDQFHAQRSDNKTFSLSLIRLRGRNATQNILLNPGGPGGSGVGFIYQWGEKLADIVGDGFHLLSFDPRGVNGSTPVATCYPSEEVERNAALSVDARVVENGPRIFAWTQNYVKACAETMDEHIQYINTPQTAADLNSILDAVGQKDMVYWGFSYGSLLGQTYATLFPDRSKRVIIDGIVNQFAYYGDRIEYEELTDTEAVFDGFFDECVKAGQNCTLASLGQSKEELRKLVIGFAEQLKHQPLSVYINNTNYGLLEYGELMFNGIRQALYDPSKWYTVADYLAKLLQGNATDAFIHTRPAKIWKISDAYHTILLNDGISGPKHWPQDRKSLADEIAPYLNSSIFAPSHHGYYYAKQQWIVPKTHNYVPKKGVKTAHPLLILSTTYDPVCPLLSAQSANDAFDGSQIVEVKGYGHCSPILPSTCAVKHVRAFLDNGTLPNGHTRCEVEGPYFVKPAEGGEAASLTYFGGPEEVLTHRLQLR